MGTALVLGLWTDEELRILMAGDVLTIAQYGSVRGAMRAPHSPSNGCISKERYWAKSLAATDSGRCEHFRL